MTSIVEKKMETLKEELKSLKSLQEAGTTVKLKGLLKGMKVDEEDFKEAKESLFS